MAAAQVVFAYTSGAISLIALAYGIVYSQLPTKKFRKLEAISQETRDLVNAACEDGFLSDRLYTDKCQRDLAR